MDLNAKELDEFKKNGVAMQLGTARYYIGNLSEMLEDSRACGEAGLSFSEANKLSESLANAVSFMQKSWRKQISPFKYYEDIAKKLLNLKVDYEHLVVNEDSGSKIGIAISDMCMAIDAYISEYRSNNHNQQSATNKPINQIPFPKAASFFIAFTIALLALDKPKQQTNFSTAIQVLGVAAFITLTICTSRPNDIQR